METGGIRQSVLAQVGGLDRAVDRVLGKLASYARASVADDRRLAMCSAGALLCGIPGSGKTRLATAVAQSAGLPHRAVHCPELFLADQGASETQLLKAFEDPEECVTSSSGTWILVLEDIDVLAGATRPDSLESRMQSLLLDCLDETRAFVIVTTSMDVSGIPEELRRAGRLDTVVELHLADAPSRAAALKIMLRNFALVADADEDIMRVAKEAHGFTGADLQSLCTRAFMDHRGATTAEHLLETIGQVTPSGLSSYQSKIPRVLFGDIFGMDETISRVRSLILEPLREPERFEEMRVDPPRGALVYGGPGTGKSLLCCAIATELAVNTIWVDATQVRSMIVGESEKAIADLFAQARKSAPCILLFDHIDVLAPRRGTNVTSENTGDRIVTSLLVEMDGFKSQSAPGVFVLAVTSRPGTVDPALLRPGRLDVHIGLGLPDTEQRRAILAGIMGRMAATAMVRNSPERMRELVERTRGHTGADLAGLCREAALCALRRDIGAETVAMDDFRQSLSRQGLGVAQKEPEHSG
ncbi:hypothetical protein GGF46_002691 [Coemansia sp. RSA 552]|nr:hypothetical protein GGF46_002691 [Coemansia sp. RSA 552]